MTADLAAELRAAADSLGELIEATRRRWDREQARYAGASWHVPVSVHEALNRDGTPLLAPLLIARANVLAALAHLERP